MSDKKLLLIDGHSILNRAYYGVPPFTNSKGVPTGGVYGFMNIMYKILDDEKPSHLVVAFDRHEPTFRHKMFGEYKGTRKPMPDDLRAQVPILKELLAACNIKTVEMPGYEADDIIGTLAKRAGNEGYEAIIVSGDRDLLQLVDENITQLIPKTKSGVTTTEVYTPEAVKETYQVTPLEFIDVKALQGDTSDNIPGVPGVGEKTAQSLIAQYHSIDGVLSHIEEVTPTRAKNAIKEHYDMAELSKTLATICIMAPVEIETEQLAIADIYTDEAYLKLSQLELKKLMKRFVDNGYSASAVTSNSTQTSTVSLPNAHLKTYDGMDTDEVEQLFEELKGKKVAVTFTQILGTDRYIITDGESVHDIKLAFMVNSAFVAEKICELIASGSEIITCTIAGLLREMELCANALTPELAEKISAEMLDKAFFDTAIGAYLMNPLQSTYEYEDIARDFLGISTFLPKTLIFDKKKSLSEDSDDTKNYIINSVLVPFYARDVIENRLKEAGMYELFRDVEMPTAFRLYELEHIGIKTDGAALKQLSDDLTVRIDKVTKEIYELAKEEFNINSPKQLGVILFEKLLIPYGKKTKSGYSTSADVLEKLAPSYPIVEKILEYRTYAKLKSTYADGLAGYIATDGRIHGHFQQTITATGRISSTEPNLQNIPVRDELGKEVRKVFVPKDGCVFVDADYSQIELRVLAHLSGDERLINAYNKDEDIHRITASEVFHVPLEEVSSKQRSAAKAVNFGIVYGESAFGLSEGLGISRKEANSYIEEYFRTYPGVKTFLDKQVLDAKNNGYVTTYYGRRRPVPELKSSNYMQRQFGERVAMNSPIQGTAADIMKMAMIATEKALRGARLESRIVLQIHDELLLEVPLAEIEAVKNLLAEAMPGVASFKVPLVVSISEGESWFETK